MSVTSSSAFRTSSSGATAANRPSLQVTYTVPPPDASPTGTITINNGAAYTNSATVTLTLSASDDSGTVSQMQFANESSAYSTPESYATTKSWMLSTGQGAKTVSVKFNDPAGHWSTPKTASITLDTAAPTITSVTASPSAKPSIGRATTISVTATDATSLSYQVTRGATVLCAWSSSASCTWTPTAADAGRQPLDAQARDAASNLSAKSSVTVYVTHQPVTP